MTSRRLVVFTLIGALTLLVYVGQRVFHRDRDTLFTRFGDERAQGIENAARGLSADIAEIGEDLELVAKLLESTETQQQAERTLRAIATIKRAYLVVYAHHRETTVRVTSIDAPPEAVALSAQKLEELLHGARDAPGVLLISGAIGAPGTAARWYRVLARRSTPDGPVVAVAVDLALMVPHLKLQRAHASKRAILDGDGHAAPGSDQELVHTLAANRARYTAALARVREGETSSTRIPADAAMAMGLPDAPAIAVGVPVTVDRGPPWTLLVVLSTVSLHHQEQTIVQRVLVGGALVLLLLSAAAAYVIHNSYRARTLRERVRHADRLAHTGKLVTAGQLAAGIAHEIGTPLNVARGRVELVMSHLGKDHPEADNHRIVIEQIDFVTRQLQQLLDYVRPAPASVALVAMDQVLATVKELIAPQASKRGVTLEIDAPASPHRLRVDPDQLQQIVVNLVVNALDACRPGGRVRMVARADDRTITIEISDDGHGIARELHKQVFDPFYTTKKRGQGTGLGLWVVAQLARAQSADIELDSTPGRGTTVRVTWPVGHDHA